MNMSKKELMYEIDEMLIKSDYVTVKAVRDALLRLRKSKGERTSCNGCFLAKMAGWKRGKLGKC